MIAYLGCETAREMLEPFIDGELPVEDQVAVEAHLRWCRTCAARVEDLSLIGAGMRTGAPSLLAGDDADLVSLQSDVLTRITAEHDQSLSTRARTMFQDMRLFWPALGASAAVLICLCGAFSVFQLASEEQPDSLAAMIETLADPGSDRNPVRLDDGISAPRALYDGVLPDRLGKDDLTFAVATVVSREGKIAGYELLDPHLTGSSGDVEAVLHAVKESRFEPAQAAGGRAVAVNMVWLFAWTKAERDTQLEELLKGSARAHRARVEPQVAGPAPAPQAPEKTEPEDRPGQRSATAVVSTTA